MKTSLLVQFCMVKTVVDLQSSFLCGPLLVSNFWLKNFISAHITHTQKTQVTKAKHAPCTRDSASQLQNIIVQRIAMVSAKSMEAAAAVILVKDMCEKYVPNEDGSNEKVLPCFIHNNSTTAANLQWSSQKCLEKDNRNGTLASLPTMWHHQTHWWPCKVNATGGKQFKEEHSKILGNVIQPMLPI